MNKRKFFAGDTLVEVMFAIGILGLVIVSVVTLMNNGSNNLRDTLEQTMTRNEIDTQAEALRFIHDSYIAERDKGDTNQTYADAWNSIKALALTDEKNISEIIDFNPSTCSELYDAKNGEVTKYGFIINYRKMAQNDVRNGLIEKGKNKFHEASVYPRLLFNGNWKDDNLYQDLTLQEKATDKVLDRVEGIYIIAVRDDKFGTVTVKEDEVTGTERTAAYYDFYIRSCWQSSGSKAPNSTSTVIRLYDPDITTVNYSLITFSVTFEDGSATSGTKPVTKSAQAKTPVYTFGIENQHMYKNSEDFIGWVESSWNENTDVCTKDNVFLPGGSVGVKYENPTITLKPVFECPYTITYYTNDNNGRVENSTVRTNSKTYVFDYTTNRPTKNGYTFLGWNDKAGATEPKTPQKSETLSAPTNTNANAYAIYRENYEIRYDANTTNSFSGMPNKQTFTSEILNKACQLATETPKQTGLKFVGWSTDKNATTPEFAAGSIITMPYKGVNKITLYAIWTEYNETFYIDLSWSSTLDLDSHVQGSKSDGSIFHAYYGSKIQSDTTGYILASLNKDVTSGNGTETMTLNTLGGRTFYYYANNYTEKNSITSATVRVRDANGNIKYTFNASSATGYGRYWNVFAYKNGEFIVSQTRSSSPQVSY